MDNQISYKNAGHDKQESTTRHQPSSQTSTGNTESYSRRVAEVFGIIPYIYHYLQRTYSYFSGHDLQIRETRQLLENKQSLSGSTEHIIQSVNQEKKPPVECNDNIQVTTENLPTDLPSTPSQPSGKSPINTLTNNPQPSVDNDATTELHSIDTTPFPDHQEKTNSNKKNTLENSDNSYQSLTKTSKPTSATEGGLPRATENNGRASDTNSTGTALSKGIPGPNLPENNSTNNVNSIETTDADISNPNDVFQEVKSKNKHRKSKINQRMKAQQFSPTHSESRVETRHSFILVPHEKLLSIPKKTYDSAVENKNTDKKINYEVYQRLIRKDPRRLTLNDKFFLGRILRKLLQIDEYVVPIMHQSLLVYCKIDPDFLSCINRYYPSALQKRYCSNHHSNDRDVLELTSELIKILHQGITTAKKQQEDKPSNPAQHNEKKEPVDEITKLAISEEQVNKAETMLKKLGFKTMYPDQRCALFLLYAEIIEANKPDHSGSMEKTTEIQAVLDIIPDFWLDKSLRESLETIKDRHDNPQNYKNNKTAGTQSNKQERTCKPEEAQFLIRTCIAKLKMQIERKDSEHHKSQYLESILGTIEFSFYYLEYLDKKEKQDWKVRSIHQKQSVINLFSLLFDYDRAIMELEKHFFEITEQTDESLSVKESYLSVVAEKLFKTITDQLQDKLYKIDKRGETPSLQKKGELTEDLSKIDKYLTAYKKNTLHQDADELLSRNIKNAMADSAYDRLHGMINDTRATDESEIQKKQKHIKKLKQMDKEATEWLDKLKLNESQFSEICHINKSAQKTPETRTRRYWNMKNTHENITLEMAKWCILHSQYDEAVSTLNSTVFQNIGLMAIKAKLLCDAEDFDNSIKEYSRILQSLPKDRKYKRHSVNVKIAMVLWRKYKENKNEGTLIASYRKIWEVVIEDLENADKYAGNLFHICQDLCKVQTNAINLQDLSSLTNSSRSWEQILRALHQINKKDNIDFSSQALTKISKTVTKFGTNLHIGQQGWH